MPVPNFRIFIALLLFSTLLQGQLRQPSAATQTAVPRLVRVSSAFYPANGEPAAAVESATLAIYAQEVGGAPLWQEIQNINVDRDGHYSVLLGVTRNEGLPTELFASGEPRWLAVRFQRPGETEQPRVLLASVPYALKAGDAETLGGRPPSSFVLADSTTSSTAAAGAATSGLKSAQPRITSGTANTIAKFINSTDLGNSVMVENAGKIGLGTTNPLDYIHSAFSDTSGTVTGYAVQNLAGGPASYSGMLFYDQNGSLAQFQGFNNSTHEYRINNIAQSGGVYNGSINFMIGSSSKLFVDRYGNVGVGTTPSAAKLDVRSSDAPTGILGLSYVEDGTGVYGAASSGSEAYGLWGASSSGYAGYFDGNVHVNGNLSKSTGTFQIDHPLDPSNKYLYHSFVESPDMMNVYNGNIITDANGRATVTLPSYFQALNSDYRYQLTAIGQFAQLIVEQEIQDNSFVIRSDKPNVKVSWQVTGIRQDAYANAHRIQVEVDKPANEKGFYLHPDLFGQPDNRQIEWARHPEFMKQRQERQSSLQGQQVSPDRHN